MDAVMTCLDEIRTTLKELKSDYSIIRKEILGIGASSPSSAHSIAVMENNTLRQIIEETQFQVNVINKTIFNGDKTNKIKVPSDQRFEGGLNQSAATESSDENVVNDLAFDFPVVEIERKTIEDDRNWMKDNWAKFHEMTETKSIADGESLRGTTVDAISSSIPFSATVQKSCTIKITNFLNSALTDPQYELWSNSVSTICRIPRIVGHHSEVVSFAGNQYGCSFLCSFSVSRFLRLTIHVYVANDGAIRLGLAFTPGVVPTDGNLPNALYAMPTGPDVWMIRNDSKVPLELFVNRGNLLVRGHMSLGPRSVGHIEILSIIDENVTSRYRIKKRIVDGKSIKPITDTKKSHSDGVSSTNETMVKSCHIEITNCLNVTLRNRSEFYCNCQENDFMPSEVLSFQREKFYAEDNEKVEAMFSYEIQSTDLVLVVALKVESGHNSFSAAFVHLPFVVGAKQLMALMDPKQWKTHLYRKYASASDGVQVIEMRNIRAEVSMSDEEQSNLKIRLFAV